MCSLIKWQTMFMCFIISRLVGMEVMFMILILSQNAIDDVRLMSKSLRSGLSQRNLKAKEGRVLYSASAYDLALVFCFLDFKAITTVPKNIQNLEVDFRETLQLPQSASTYVVIFILDWLGNKIPTLQENMSFATPILFLRFLLLTSLIRSR